MFEIEKLFLTIKAKFFEVPNIVLFQWVNLWFGLKNAFFFLYLFSVKIRLEIRFNNVLDRKKPFLTIKTKFFNVSKIVFFQRG